MKKIKHFIVEVQKKCREKKQQFNQYVEHNWKDTGKLLYWVTLLLFSFCIGLMTGNFIYPAWRGILLVTIIALVLTMFVLWLLKKILRIFLKNGITEFLSWLLLCILCIFILTGNSYAAGMSENTIFAILFSLIAALFLKSLWALLFHKVRTKTIFVTLILAGIPVVGVTVLLSIGGFSDTYIMQYLELSNAGSLTETEKMEFTESMKDGSYTVMTATYGTSGEEDIASTTTNISHFAGNEGINGFFKEQYQGYPLTETPLSGIVWYPEEIDNCPTLFIIHGNHSWITDSYLGYEYLGTYLASKGYVVVSVDENACNGLSDENDARAILLLENIKQVERFNLQKENILYQKMDYDNLALAGHSRGGEAIATAYLFNELEYYPDNGNRRFYYHFSINSLIAIAPVYGQYQPSDRDVELSDVNYLVMHGANDQDVSIFMGMEQYENISFTGEKDCIKTSLYVAGLNHGQFNSLWGKYDSGEPLNRILNVENFLSQEEQQQIAKIFVKTFLDKTLKHKSECADLLMNCEKYNELLPKTLYVQSYDTSDAITICDFEEDTRLETGSLENVRIKAQNVDSWREEQLTFSTGDFRGNYAAVLKWNQEENTETAEITFALSEMDLKGREVRFDIMNLQEDFEEEKAELLEAEIVVTDSDGKEACVRVGDDTAIYPAFPVRLNKLQYIFGTAEYKHQFQTVSIPIEDFAGVDVMRISSITIRFPQESGKVAVDNIKVSSYMK